VASPGPYTAAEWCVFTESGGPGDLLVERLRSEGATVSVVRPGSGFARPSAREWVVDPLCRADYDRVLGDLQAGAGIPGRFIHLWSPNGSPGVADEAERADAGFMSVLQLAQAIGSRQSRDTILTVVTSGAMDVTGEESLSPGCATVLGLCRVIPQEYPLLSCRNVDVEAKASPSETADQIRVEIATAGKDPVVAYRGRYRWVQSFEPVPAGSAEPAPGRLRAGGVYLVTGGLGRVGLALAEHLARAAKARLVLVGRTGLPGRSRWDDHLTNAGADDAVALRIRALRALEALGSEVLVVSADAGDREQMRRALGLARERFGSLHGVIHAAGDLGPGVLRPLAQMDPADCERQLRPKARGAEILDELLGDERLDFLMLVSSLSTVLGGLGFAAYAAANHYLDAFARRQHQRGRPWWISVDWDGWRFAPATAAESDFASTAMSPAEGREVFARVLGLAPLPQVVVSTAPLHERLEQWARLVPRANETTDAPGADASLQPRPDLHTVYVAPADAVERRLAEIWGQLLGVERVGADDNFFELGGSSLLAIHLIGKLRKEFSADLSVTTLFDAPTVRALSRVVHAPGGAVKELERSQDRGHLRRQSRRGQRRTSDAAVE
jgi:NAD(P)-dependent dehydrogenase (short-subunit alcohol dehydrogenase family)/acyl carrier protein